MIGLRRGLVHGAKIAALGVSIPERILTNAELAGTLDTSDEWISSRTGIRERRVVPARPGHVRPGNRGGQRPAGHATAITPKTSTS